MNFRASHSLGLLTAACLLALSQAHAQQSFPVKPIRMVVPSAPGGGTDFTARLLAPRLTEALGQQVVVENRGGAAGAIGMEFVMRAPPDGHTVVMGISTMTVTPALRKNLPYDVVRDFAPVSRVITQPNVLIVHPALPVRSVKELIQFVRARPGQLDYGTAGIGSSVHAAMLLFLDMTRLEVNTINYKGSGPGMIDLMSGHISLMMPTLLAGLPHVRSGRVRALGVTGSKRAASLPEVPAISEAGVPGYEAVNWLGILAPAKTPREAVQALNAATLRSLQDAGVRDRLLADGAEPAGTTPEEFSRLIGTELAKWARVLKSVKL